ncbi:folylpolyglutamate synthase, mitochondrial-like [Halichoeres trimaculatus]|uniref:folylpolyglutamate synthase, mitochondrial-like n=1 Tax=Halichoeres trimaculatus TaxID=147232 RepID=UPI003D9E7947
MDRYPKGFTEKDAFCILNSLMKSSSPTEKKEKEQIFLVKKKFIERVGLSVEELDRLNIIHVAGTKGKGSTCAFTEQILRGYGFRTGFLSSPHLVSPRERIRLNGQPISNELFNKHLVEVFERLDGTKDANDGKMPTFGCFFTLLAFWVFLEEKVEVAVVEVGLGGQYDQTNVIRKPWVCGIALLDMDHTESLGNTIEEIAWHKGGIFKPGVPAFTVKQQEGAMAMLRDRAKETGCPLKVCPDLEDYQTDHSPLLLSLAGKHQHSNASLALQLSHSWLQRRFQSDESCPTTIAENAGVPRAASFKPSPFMVKGLAETVWPGRTQIIKRGNVTYFLDGAHTRRSIQACAEWFKETSAEHERNASGPVARVLLFNVSGKRDSTALLKLLVPYQFDFAVFCPNIPDSSKICPTDLVNKFVQEEEMMNRCLLNESSWRLLNNQENKNDTHPLMEDSLSLVPKRKGGSLVFPCIHGALQWISQGHDPLLTDSTLPVKPSIQDKAVELSDAAELHVLVTGSLYLVGGVLKNLEPESYE